MPTSSWTLPAAEVADCLDGFLRRVEEGGRGGTSEETFSSSSSSGSVGGDVYRVARGRRSTHLGKKGKKTGLNIIRVKYKQLKHISRKNLFTHGEKKKKTNNTVCIKANAIIITVTHLENLKISQNTSVQIITTNKKNIVQYSFQKLKKNTISTITFACRPRVGMTCCRRNEKFS